MSPKWFDLRRLLGLSTASTEMSAGAPADDFLENEPVRANMRKHGDDGRIPRPLDHYAYFRSLESRETYREFILSRGYRVKREDVSGNDDGRVAIIFSKVQAPVAIDKETALLEYHAVGLGGDYDGWETDIVRG